MWTERVYSEDDVSQLKHLAEIGIKIEHYDFDKLLSQEVCEKFDRVRDRIEHIKDVIYRLDWEKRALEDILRGKLFELVEEEWDRAGRELYKREGP